ncbi:hypothetical protein A3E49_01665 [Candidatus Saccharibacteria bacterium RIFCSPHIGHO2_12_FULL_49_19]|nr:MAG: hypothetical protein A3E49_01665 [Candidatus Saccharibacteria bacterium RIFCSPHIGHO2_12_FULL_49_19]OGL38018.1 MAG: hypothetical protein A3B63_03260 [Candidatus Saccharibacteria bacterium RIFCSPLOWO2_01_FULL_49_22]
MRGPKLYWMILTIGAAVGLLASFLQMLEKITLVKNSEAVLSCNLNSVFNCSNVLNASQSSVFGFPNSLLCIVFFSLLLAAGLIGWTGGAINAKLRFFFQFMALFFAGFGFWYFWQSIFNIGVLCIYCVFCYGGVLAINGALFRLNYKDYPLSKKTMAKLDTWVARGADLFFWCLIALVIALEAIIKFA